jgi:hypothetical protein
MADLILTPNIRVFLDLFVSDIRDVGGSVSPCDNQEEKLQRVELCNPAEPKVHERGNRSRRIHALERKLGPSGGNIVISEFVNAASVVWFTFNDLSVFQCVKTLGNFRTTQAGQRAKVIDWINHGRLDFSSVGMNAPSVPRFS